MKLRQKVLVVKYKRVERLYREAGLQVHRRKRKKVPLGECLPLMRPSAANEVWPMDFMFDRTEEGRVIRRLIVVDDATHESPAMEVERAVSRQGVSRVRDTLAQQRGLPQVIRTDNGKEFCGKAMVAWTHERVVALRLIEPAKANQNAFVESFNGDCATITSTSIGFQHCFMPVPASKARGATTTKKDPSERWAG